MFYVTYINQIGERRSKLVLGDDLCKMKSILMRVGCYCITHSMIGSDGLDKLV